MGVIMNRQATGTRRPRAGFGSNKYIPYPRGGSGLSACISSRITTVIQVAQGTIK